MNIYNLFYKAPAPEGIEERNAHIIGGGIAGLAAAVFLIDDAGMPGKNITLYEKRNSLGGCCDAYSGEAGYICPGQQGLSYEEASCGNQGIRHYAIPSHEL